MVKNNQNSKQQITLCFDKSALDLIDKAAKLEFSSRTSYITRHCVNVARELVGEQ